MIPDELKSKILEICERNNQGEYSSEGAKENLCRIAEELELDPRAVLKEIHEKKDFVTWGGAPQEAFPVLQLLASRPPEQREEVICWMLGNNETRWIGAGCYRLFPDKSEGMYRACFEAALRELDPSEVKRFVKPCCLHKGHFQVFQDIHRVVLDDGRTDAERAGALNAIYWTGVDSWPSVEEYDRYKAAPDQTIEATVKSVVDALQRYYIPSVKGAECDDDDVRRIVRNQYTVYDRLDRDTLTLKDQLEADISNCCLELFLDVNRSLELRKMAYLHFPKQESRGAPGRMERLLTPKNRERLPEVHEAAKIFPDGYIQSSLNAKIREGEPPLLYPVNAPLTWRQKLLIVARRIVKIP